MLGRSIALRLQHMSNLVTLGDLAEAMYTIDDSKMWPQIEKIIDQQPWTPSPRWRRLLEENVRALETFSFFTKVQTRQDDWVGVNNNRNYINLGKL